VAQYDEKEIYCHDGKCGALMMDFLTNVFDSILSSLLSGFDLKNISELETFLQFSGDVVIIFEWVKLFLPLEVIGTLFALTAIYYVTRFVWAIIKIIKSAISGNNSLISLFNGGS
jgi:hypothetical protein